MKKIICLILTLCLMFSFAACGGDDSNVPSDTQQPSAGDALTNGEGENADAENEQDADAAADKDAAGAEDEEKADTADDTADKADKKDDGKKEEASKPTNSDNTQSSSQSKPSSSNNKADKNDKADKTDKADKADKAEASTPTSALNLLSTVWKSYKNDEKFPACGGDYSEENRRDDAPGKFSISDTDGLQSTLAVPEDAIGYVSGAASLTHMMNLNTFTAASLKAKSGEADKLAAAMKESIQNRHWMCGFPDKFVIMTIDRYVVSVFGGAEQVDTFKSKTQKAFPSVKIYCEENIA